MGGMWGDGGMGRWHSGVPPSVEMLFWGVAWITLVVLVASLLLVVGVLGKAAPQGVFCPWCCLKGGK